MARWLEAKLPDLGGPPLPRASCVTLGKSLNFSVPYFPPL